MPNQANPPSVTATAFACPHCGAYTTQYWHKLTASQLDEKTPTPNFPQPDLVEQQKFKDSPPEIRQLLLRWVESINSGFVVLEKHGTNRYINADVGNLNLSECYNCQKVAVWVHKSLVFPATREGPPPNQDLPAEILRDFEEARSILGLSPRGAAALLRLCVQKLCGSLGEEGKRIDEDIASLVRKGLSPLVQQSLDIVRVIGNEAVHPGTMDLRDDYDTAAKLFDIVNIIASQMITQPKHIREIYEKLPEEKRNAIERRDAPTK